MAFSFGTTITYNIPPTDDDFGTAHVSAILIYIL